LGLVGCFPTFVSAVLLVRQSADFLESMID
jgi:hypothetical protein